MAGIPYGEAASTMRRLGVAMTNLGAKYGAQALYARPQRIVCKTVFERYPKIFPDKSRMEHLFEFFSEMISIEKSALSAPEALAYEELEMHLEQFEKLHELMRKANDDAAKKNAKEAKKKGKGKKKDSEASDATESSAAVAEGGSTAADGDSDPDKPFPDFAFLGANRIIAPQDVNAVVTDTELEEAGLTDKDQFVPADRITPDDKNNVTTSLKRKLGEKLYFVIKDENGNWTFPSYEFEPETTPTLRRAAETALASKVDMAELESYFLSNAPNAASRVMEDDQVLEKTFYYRSIFVRGRFKPVRGISAYQWLSTEELHDALQPQEYETVHRFLYHSDSPEYP